MIPDYLRARSVSVCLVCNVCYLHAHNHACKVAQLGEAMVPKQMLKAERSALIAAHHRCCYRNCNGRRRRPSAAQTSIYDDGLTTP